jgi:S1-C subfamily serine protease
VAKPLPRKRSQAQNSNSRQSGQEQINAIAIGIGIAGFLAAIVMAVMHFRAQTPVGGASYAQTTPTPPPPPPVSPNTSPVLEAKVSADSLTSAATKTSEVPTAASEVPPAANPGGSALMLAKTEPPAAEPPDAPPVPAAELSLPDLIDQVEQAVVRIIVEGEYGKSLGSGFVVDADGTIVTNYHVVEGARSATANFRDGTSVPVEGVLALDSELDLAIIKIAPRDKNFRPIPLAAAIPRKGEKVVTFGAPKGFGFTSSEGIISGLRKAEEVGHQQGVYVQTTAAISPGNSGGPLTNMLGEVVGVNSFKWREGESLNFAVSCIDVAKVLKERKPQSVPLSPETVPVKIAEEHIPSENLVGTERAKVLLSQIREIVFVKLPVSFDPTGRVTDYVMSSAERTLEQKLKWEVITQSSQMKASTAIVLIMMVFLPDEDDDAGIVNDLSLHTIIIVREVDKDGAESLAKVWDEKTSVGKVSLSALTQGIVSRTLQGRVKQYFDHLVSEYRIAVRSVEQ